MALIQRSKQILLVQMIAAGDVDDTGAPRQTRESRGAQDARRLRRQREEIDQDLGLFEERMQSLRAMEGRDAGQAAWRPALAQHLEVESSELADEIAAQHAATPAQVSLAWLLHQGPDIVPIPGTKRRLYLEENLQAAGLQLSTAELERLDAALAPGAVAGPRYHPRLMAFIDR